MKSRTSKSTISGNIRILTVLSTLTVTASLPSLAQDDATSQSNSMTSTAGCPSVMPDTQIEVTADLSEFRQTEKVVLLQGSVDVIQGPLRVRAETIKLQYEPNDKSSDKAYAGTVTSLQADGNVRIDCNGEHAEGEQAYYDILQRTIKLTGDVLLVREGNILRGDRLDIDLNSGRSAIVGDATVSKKPGKGRVHAIFKPTEKDG